MVRWARRHGAKLVWNQNGVAYPSWAGDDYSTINQEMAALLAEADIVIYQSQFSKDCADKYLGPARCDSRILYNRSIPLL